MKIRTTFVGINRHNDPRIPELTGASRDARALWALFCDTTEVDATLLIDEEATAAVVRHALNEALSQAEADDLVFFTFAGHGTHDHRLVLSDTDPDRLHETSIGMDELANMFRACKARAIVCVLDCCFSGAAPARVLESSPIPRDIRPAFEIIGGKGRLLIAASSQNEPAWEQPGTGHGLLTQALIDVLTQPGDEDTVTLTSAADEIIQRAQIEARRMGVTQTPVVLNYVEGVLRFPKLRRGRRFLAAFPEFDAPQISGQISELSAYGFAASIVSGMQQRFPNGLNSLQLEAVNVFRVLRGQSLLTIAPTSSGKTFIGELAAIRAVEQGQKAVFLLPYRALVNEKFDTFTTAYAAAGIRVVRCTGDYSDQASLVHSGKYDLAVFTYEMFLSLALSNARVLSQLGAVILDEGQFITDPNRGITVELILTLLIRARAQGINPQLVVLSAVIGGVNSFDQWLGSKMQVSTVRPVPLVEGVLDRAGVFEYLDKSGQPQTEQYLPRTEIRQRKEKPSSQDVIVPLARKLIAAGEKIIVFRNMRGPAEGCAAYLAAELGLPLAHAALAALPDQNHSTTSERLRECLAGGTAFHNSNLAREERQVVESHFRAKDGGIAALGATTTLAAGINTPADTVVLAETEFVGEDGRAFTIAEYKNMIGRAGRLGFRDSGRSILLAENGLERRNLFRRYVLGTPESARSSFSEADLNTWILRLLSQARRVRSDQVVELLLNTYGGFLATKENPSWPSVVTSRLSELLKRMVALGLAEQDGDYIQLTLLGQACGRSSLSFESSLRLIELVKQNADKLTAVDLLALVQVLEESDGLYTPVMKKGQAENARISDVARRFGNGIASFLQRFAREQHVYWARCKRSAIAWDWINGESADVIESRYSPNPYQGRIAFGDITRIVDGTRFHLRSATQIVSLLIPGDETLLSELGSLVTRLEAGCPTDALWLLDLPVSLTRVQMLMLHKAKVHDEKALWSLSAEQLVVAVGHATAEKLEKHRSSTPSAASIVADSGVGT